MRIRILLSLMTLSFVAVSAQAGAFSFPEGLPNQPGNCVARFFVTDCWYNSGLKSEISCDGENAISLGDISQDSPSEFRSALTLSLMDLGLAAPDCTPIAGADHCGFGGVECQFFPNGTALAPVAPAPTPVASGASSLSPWSFW